MKIKIRLTEPMLGTVPKDPEVYKSYIETKKPEGENEQEYLTVEKIEEKGWTGFHKDDKGLFIYDYMIRGFLKNAGNILKEVVGIKNIKSKIDNVVFVFPRRIYLGKIIPDGVIERPLRAMTMQGPRVTLARSEYVDAGVEMEIEIKIIPNKEITESVLMSLFEYGQLCGLGQFRNGSYGRFEVMLMYDGVK